MFEAILGLAGNKDKENLRRVTVLAEKISRTNSLMLGVHEKDKPFQFIEAVLEKLSKEHSELIDALSEMERKEVIAKEVLAHREKPVPVIEYGPSISTDEAADMMNVTDSQIRYYVRRGLLNAFQEKGQSGTGYRHRILLDKKFERVKNKPKKRRKK